MKCFTLSLERPLTIAMCLEPQKNRMNCGEKCGRPTRKEPFSAAAPREMILLKNMGL